MIRRASPSRKMSICPAKSQSPSSFLLTADADSTTAVFFPPQSIFRRPITGRSYLRDLAHHSQPSIGRVRTVKTEVPSDKNIEELLTKNELRDFRGVDREVLEGS